MPKKKTTSKGVSSVSPKLGLAAEVAKRVQIEDVRLIETRAAQRLRHGKLPSRMDMGVGTTTVADGDSSRIRVNIRFELCVQYDEDPAEIVPIELSALFRVTYGISSLAELTNEHIDAFGELNGVYNVWPYWREYVQSTILRMGLPPLVVPVFRPHEHLGKASGKETLTAVAETLAAIKEKLAATKKKAAASKKKAVATKKRTRVSRKAVQP